MKKMMLALSFLSAQNLNCVWSDYVVLTLNNKNLAEAYRCFNAMTPEQIEDKKSHFAQSYAFYQLMQAKLQEGNDTNCTYDSIPPVKQAMAYLLSKDENEKFISWIEEQQKYSWLELQFWCPKLEKTIIKRFFDEKMKEYVVGYDMHNSLNHAIYLQYLKDEQERHDIARGERAIERLEQLCGD